MDFDLDNFCESECGNTWLSSESGGNYILIGLNINDNDSETSQFLEISILPENYPGLNVCTVTEYVKNIVEHIQERYEGWVCRKWNLPIEAPINEDGEIVGESVKELQFTCPNCKNHSLEEVMSNVSVASEISTIRSDGDIDYGEQTNEDGSVSQYQCMSCGYIIGQEEKELITDHIDMVNWVKSHCPQED